MSSSVKDEKKNVISLYFGGDHCIVHVDSRHPDVNVPTQYRSTPAVSFRLSQNFVGLTEFSEHGIESDLLFGAQRYLCFLPWESVWGVTSETGAYTLWSESIPPEILPQVLMQATGALERMTENEAETSTVKKVAAGKKPVEAKKAEKTVESKPIARGHLTRVK